MAYKTQGILRDIFSKKNAPYMSSNTVIHSPNIWLKKFWGKNLSCIGSLEFVAAKFKQNWTFIQLFILFLKRIFIVYVMFQSTKYTQYLEQKQRLVHAKM